MLPANSLSFSLQDPHGNSILLRGPLGSVLIPAKPTTLIDMNKKYPTVFLVILLFMYGCTAPSIRHLASPVSGTLSIDGVPAKGVEIVRSTDSAWYDNLTEEVTHCSDQGVFNFRGITAMSPGGLIHQPGVRIKIIAKVNSEEYVLFDIFKSNYEKFGELDYEKPSGIAEVTESSKRILLHADIQQTPNGPVE